MYATDRGMFRRADDGRWLWRMRRGFGTVRCGREVRERRGRQLAQGCGVDAESLRVPADERSGGRSVIRRRNV